MSPMMHPGSFPQEPILFEERYPATLKEVVEYEKDYGEGPVPKLAWIFLVQAKEDDVDDSIPFEGDLSEDSLFEIAAHTSFATGPNSNFAKLNFPVLTGESWSGDTDELIGKACIVDVTSFETKGGQQRNVVEKIRAPKKNQNPAKIENRANGGEQAKKQRKVNAKADVEEENDFADIPF